MRFLFDQNISHRILKIIANQFPESTTVKKEGLINAPDKEIWEFAKLNDFIIVTQDADFDDLNSLYGFPPKIIWIRTGNLKTHAIVDILNDYSDEINHFVKNPDFGCFEIFKFK
jgi:predicted nuclease of predicted toxin-antitoxin system